MEMTYEEAYKYLKESDKLRIPFSVRDYKTLLMDLLHQIVNEDISCHVFIKSGHYMLTINVDEKEERIRYEPYKYCIDCQPLEFVEGLHRPAPCSHSHA